jgi:hypothetical protein
MKGKLVKANRKFRNYAYNGENVPEGEIGVVVHDKGASVVMVRWFNSNYPDCYTMRHNLEIVETAEQHYGRPFKEKVDAQGG